MRMLQSYLQQLSCLNCGLKSYQNCINDADYVYAPCVSVCASVLRHKTNWLLKREHRTQQGQQHGNSIHN